MCPTANGDHVHSHPAPAVGAGAGDGDHLGQILAALQALTAKQDSLAKQVCPPPTPTPYPPLLSSRITTSPSVLPSSGLRSVRRYDHHLAQWSTALR